MYVKDIYRFKYIVVYHREDSAKSQVCGQSQLCGQYTRGELDILTCVMHVMINQVQYALVYGVSFLC